MRENNAQGEKDISEDRKTKRKFPMKPGEIETSFGGSFKAAEFWACASS